MRDLALVASGYVFSKNGHMLVKTQNGQYSSIIDDAKLGMKFDT